MADQHVEVCAAHAETVKEIGRRVPIWIMIVMMSMFVSMFGFLYSKLESLNIVLHSVEKKQAVVMYHLKIQDYDVADKEP